ncbi:hypothetical protein EV177_007833, partial [Coemansia sp. RSA 1804]
MRATARCTTALAVVEEPADWSIGSVASNSRTERSALRYTGIPAVAAGGSACCARPPALLPLRRTHLRWHTPSRSAAPSFRASARRSGSQAAPSMRSPLTANDEGSSPPLLVLVPVLVLVLVSSDNEMASSSSEHCSCLATAWRVAVTKASGCRSPPSQTRWVWISRTAAPGEECDWLRLRSMRSTSSRDCSRRLAKSATHAVSEQSRGTVYVPAQARGTQPAPKSASSRRRWLLAATDRAQLRQIAPHLRQQRARNRVLALDDAQQRSLRGRRRLRSTATATASGIGGREKRGKRLGERRRKAGCQRLGLAHVGRLAGALGIGAAIGRHALAVGIAGIHTAVATISIVVTIVIVIHQRPQPARIGEQPAALLHQQQRLGIRRQAEPGGRLAVGQRVAPADKVVEAGALGRKQRRRLAAAAAIGGIDQRKLGAVRVGAEPARNKRLEHAPVVVAVDAPAIHAGAKQRADRGPRNARRIDVGLAGGGGADPAVNRGARTREVGIAELVPAGPAERRIPQPLDDHRVQPRQQEVQAGALGRRSPRVAAAGVAGVAEALQQVRADAGRRLEHEGARAAQQAVRHRRVDLHRQEQAERRVGAQRLQALLELRQPGRRQMHVLQQHPAAALGCAGNRLVGQRKALDGAHGHRHHGAAHLLRQRIHAVGGIVPGHRAQRNRRRCRDLGGGDRAQIRIGHHAGGLERRSGAAGVVVLASKHRRREPRRRRKHAVRPQQAHHDEVAQRHGGRHRAEEGAVGQTGGARHAALGVGGSQEGSPLGSIRSVGAFEAPDPDAAPAQAARVRIHGAQRVGAHQRSQRLRQRRRRCRCSCSCRRRGSAGVAQQEVEVGVDPRPGLLRARSIAGGAPDLRQLQQQHQLAVVVHGRRRAR